VVNFPALPEYEKRVSVTGPSTGEDTKTERLSDEQKTKLGAVQDVASQEIAATAPVRALKEREAQIGQQDIEAQQFAADAEQNLRNGPEARAAQDYVDYARRRTREQEAKFDAAPPPALFADRNGWDSVRLAIGLGLAGLGDGMLAAAAIRAGHAPSNRNTVGDIISRDLERQRSAIEKLKDNVVTARTGLKDAEEARRVLLADLDLKAKAIYRKAEMLTRSRLAALKLDQAAIDQTKDILDIKSRVTQHEADYVKSHTDNVTKRWDSAKATTETINRVPTAGEAGKLPGQQVALAKQALVELEKLENGALPAPDALNKVQDNALTSSAADTSIEGGKLVSGGISMAGRALDVVPRNKYEGLSEQDRITFQSMDRAQQLLMHVMTGAGASMEEARKKAEAFGWVPGDTPASMKAKIAGAKELAHQFAGTAPAASPAGAPTPAVAQRAPQTEDEKVSAAREVLADKSAPAKMRDEARRFLRDREIERIKKKGKR
jgi:hypothetical protein